MKLALQFGAGNIGRGFLGQLFYESGFHTLFVDVIPEVVEAINSRKSYPITIIGEKEYTITVENISAVLLSDRDKVVKAIEEAEIVATAVGAKGISDVISALAEGIARRLQNPIIKPLNIIICENLPEPGQTFYREIVSHLPQNLIKPFEEHVGLVEASIGRMVPIMKDKNKQEHPLLVRVEEYCELPVDKDAFKGDIPQIKGLKLCSPFSGYIHRKLYIHNLTHAICAYLGRLKGYTYIWESVEDKGIRQIARDAGQESAQAINKLDGLPYKELIDYIDDLLIRYSNRHLGDQIERVARDPIRKLSPGERLVGSATYCLKAGIEPEHIALGIAAAIYYDGEDESSQKLKEMRTKYGVEEVLKTICKIEASSFLFAQIKKSIEKLQNMKWLNLK